MPGRDLIAASALLAFVLPLPVVFADEIHTGGATGAYHSVFCPLVKRRIGELGDQYSCSTSAGTAANVAQIARNPSHFALGQLDAFTLESRAYGGLSRFQIEFMVSYHNKTMLFICLEIHLFFP